MDEEVKGRVERIIRMSLFRGCLIRTVESIRDDVLALVVAERDAMKEAAAQHSPVWIEKDHMGKMYCSCGGAGADGITPYADIWADHVRSLTPSTAQSREREIRLDEARLALKGINETFESESSSALRLAQIRGRAIVRVDELSASSQPKGDRDEG